MFRSQICQIYLKSPKSEKFDCPTSIQFENRTSGKILDQTEDLKSDQQQSKADIHYGAKLLNSNGSKSET